MTLINLKFSPEMEELILRGKKCCTTRDESKGQVGDVFRVGNRIYRIVQIVECLLEDAYIMRSAEGFKSDIAFIDTIRDIYPELCSLDIVYVHFFAYVGDWCPQFGVISAACSNPEEFCELYSDCVKARG